MIDTTTNAWLPRAGLDRLIALLREDGRRVIGPTVRDSAIVYDDVHSVADLPVGITDEQAPGVYRIHEATEGADGADGTDAPDLTTAATTAARASDKIAKASDKAAGVSGKAARMADDGATNGGTGSTGKAGRAFDHASSPTSWKHFLYPPKVPIAMARRDGDEVTYVNLERDAQPMAFLGVRACDIAAIAVQDDVLTGGPYIDEDYADRRGKAFIVAVECGSPSSTCFCASMGTGPEVTRGFDIALTELDDGFVVRAGTEAGRKLLERLDLDPSTLLQQHEAVGVGVGARAVMSRQLGVTTDGLKDRLMGQLESEGWQKVAERCLACTNCTMSCPTCFCVSVGQVSDLFGHETVSNREWASCFTLDFARVAGGNFRSRRQDRYRQWLTHKFSTWIDQFGSFGCIGCGRCITWCPVGIDVREELASIAPVRPPLERTEWPVPVSANPGRYSLGVVGDIWAETSDTYTLVLDDLPKAVTSGGPGQFLMLDLPGYSGVPISVSRYRDGQVYLTIRAAGATTKAITTLREGAQIGIRGPLGVGWSMEEGYGRDVVIVAGGIGLAPLRPLIDAILADRSRFNKVQLFYGARTPGDMLYKGELRTWAHRDDLQVAVTVDRGDASWTGAVGVVTHLFDREPIDSSHTTAYVCGPEKMMTATSNALAGRGILPVRIFLSMERHMECGIGLCGHCQMGRYFICKDGPVFSRSQLGESFDVEGL